MFGTKVKSKIGNNETTGTGFETESSSNFIAAGTTIEGKFFSTEDIRIDGFIHGDVTCEKRLVMGPTGKIEGKTYCKGSSINGTIEGELKVDGTLHLSDSSSVDGLIKARKLIVDEGASYSGECLIGEKHF